MRRRRAVAAAARARPRTARASDRIGFGLRPVGVLAPSGRRRVDLSDDRSVSATRRRCNGSFVPTSRRTVTHTKPKLTRRQRKKPLPQLDAEQLPLRRAHAQLVEIVGGQQGQIRHALRPEALQRPEVRAEAPRQEPLVEPRRRLLPRRRGHGGVVALRRVGRRRRPGPPGIGRRARARAVRRRWTTCSTTSRVPPGVGGTSSVTSSDDPNSLSCRRALPILSPFVSRGVRGASPPHALSRAAASPSSEKGEKGAAGARASNLTSVRCGSASVLSDPSSLPLSARPKPQEMLPMSVVSDMVDDGALSGALMSFVGVSSCGAAIAGARRTRRVWAAWSRSGRVPRARIAPRRPATTRRGPGRKKIVRAPRFLQLFTPGNSRSARRGRPALHRRRPAHLLVRRGAATPAAARRAGSTSRQPLFHQRVRGRGWCHTRQKRQ